MRVTPSKTVANTMLADEYFIYRANLKGFAPHIHVLYREVPYILYITRSAATR